MADAGRGLDRLLRAVVDVRPREVATTGLMFVYAFTAMTSYNIVQPLTRSAFIADLGADNVPYVLLVTGLLIGVIMQVYTRVTAALPERSALPLVQLGMGLILLAFVALMATGGGLASSAFYVYGQVLGTLLLSQFWTLANEVYDPRQARRLFGFIGAGSSLGGMAGSGLAALVAPRLGTSGLLVVSAATLAVTAGIVSLVLARERDVARSAHSATATPAWRLGDMLARIRASPTLRQLTLLISFSAAGAMVLDQQLNLAAESFRGGDEDAVTSFLATVRFALSAVSLVMQLVLVKQIYRRLGIGFALVLLPVSLGLSSGVILLTAALWAPAAASVVDRSIRYTVDRTTREIFFLPLDREVRRQVKAFVDVTADRVARGLGAVVVLLVIKPWGLGLAWPQLSLVTLVLAGVWLRVAVRARTRYVASIRQGLEAQVVTPEDLRVDVADLDTIETLLEELAHPEERRVLYAIDVLESLDKRNLVTPLLLRHTSAAVRARALGILAEERRGVRLAHWEPRIRQMVEDSDPEIRAKAITALATIRHQDAARLARELLASSDEDRLAVSAAVVLAASDRPADVTDADALLTRLVSNAEHTTPAIRQDVARALRGVDSAWGRQLLIPLLQDAEPEVASEAMASVAATEPRDPLFLPTLVSLIGDRRLGPDARQVLAGYEERALDMLGHVLADPDEDPAVRRQVPAVLSAIVSDSSMELLAGALTTPDRRLRDRVVDAMASLARRRPALRVPSAVVERLVTDETRDYFEALTRRHDVFTRGGLDPGTTLHRALTEKMDAAVHRTYQLLGLLYGWRDVATARRAVEHGPAAARAQAFELLDNIVAPHLRRGVLTMLEDLPLEQKARHGHYLRRTSPGDVEHALRALLEDPDEVVAAAAIDLVRSDDRQPLLADVEHALATRDAHDWLVFEAASWTLASARLGAAERQARWREPLPAIVLTERVQRLAMFQSVPVAELCRLAGSGRQERHDDGTVLLRERVVPEAFHVLLDGEVRVEPRAETSRRRGGPALLGFEAVLRGRPSPETVRAEGSAVTAAVTRRALLEALSDQPGLVAGLFRTVLEAVASRGDLIVRAGAEPLVFPVVPDVTPITTMLMLRQVPLFARLEAEELSRITTITRRQVLAAGPVTLDVDGTPVVRTLLAGSVAVEDGEGQSVGRATAGDTIGLFEALAGGGRSTPRGSTRLRAVDECVVLEMDAPGLFDLIAGRPRLVQHLFATLFAPSGQVAGAPTIP